MVAQELRSTPCTSIGQVKKVEGNALSRFQLRIVFRLKICSHMKCQTIKLCMKKCSESLN